jgi:hypothetical protein
MSIVLGTMLDSGLIEEARWYTRGGRRERGGWVSVAVRVRERGTDKRG